jgi:hypothetical protein
MRTHLKSLVLVTSSLFVAATLVQAQSSDLVSGLTLATGPTLNDSSLSTPPLVFDNISDLENGVAGAAANATSSTPNTFMGCAYTLAPGTTSITGFDLFPVNLSGTTFNALKINIWVWGTVNTGTVNASTPAFGNLLGSYTLTSSGTFASGFYYNYEGSPVGGSPGIALGTPLAIPSTTIGLTFNYQGSTDGGVTYNNVNSLTSLITSGTPPTVGSLVFNGYYRNANSEVNGNFTSTLRSLGLQNQGLAARIYTVVPEPTSACFLGLGLGAWLVARLRGNRTA